MDPQARRPRTLRLEPWGVSYLGSFQDDGPGEDDTDGSSKPLDASAVGIELPLEEWRPVVPARSVPITRALFLDGVRRLEARAVLDGETSQSFAAIGSLAVGAVECRLQDEPSARLLADPVIERWCLIAAAAIDEEDVVIRAGAGRPIVYRTAAAPGDDPQAPADELQRLMRQAEARLTTALRRALDRERGGAPMPGSLLVCDGPRPFIGRDPHVVGYLKTVQQQRLPARAFEVVRGLEEGQRSPIYLVGTGANARFEWYVRLRDPRPWLHSLAGSVRLQAHAGEQPASELDDAKVVADWSATELPRFATRAHQDPRAPQQLLPVRALEENLRRRLGSAPLLRRRVEVALATGGSGT